MTDTTETTTPADATPTEGEQQTPDPTPAEETPEEPQHKRPEHEAAKYRRQLRETEAERDALAARLATWEREIVQAAAASYLERPETLWTLGYTLESVRNDEGDIDPERVRAVCAEAQEKYGLRGAPVAQPGGLSDPGALSEEIRAAVGLRGPLTPAEMEARTRGQQQRPPAGYELVETRLTPDYSRIPAPGGAGPLTQAPPAWRRILDPTDSLRR